MPAESTLLWSGIVLKEIRIGVLVGPAPPPIRSTNAAREMHGLGEGF